jgi:hypothetical protein
MSSSSRSVPGLWPGLVLISLGGGLLARELGMLPPGIRIVDFWPLLVVVFGVAQLPHVQGLVGAFFALGFAALGGVLLAGNLGFGDFTAARYWPALLILLGLSFLFGVRGKSRRRGCRPHEGRPVTRDGTPAEYMVVSDDSRLVRSLSMSGAQYRIESQAWTGGDLSATAAGIELDLRHARLAEGGATLNLHVVAAGVDIQIPDTWLVISDMSVTLGGVDDTTRPTHGDPSAPRLRLVGSVLLGGVSIRN